MFKLAEAYPAVNAGKTIADANGFAVEKDFFGNEAATPTPDAGAYESAASDGDLAIGSGVYGVDNTENTIGGLEKNTTVKEFLDNIVLDSGVSIMVMSEEGKELEANDLMTEKCTVVIKKGQQEKNYRFGVSSDAEIKSSVFEYEEKGEEKIYNIPSTENNPAALESIKDGFETDPSATITFWNGVEEVKEGSVTDGLAMKVTAGDGKTSESYTLKIKNIYNYVNDFKENQQGNVWFAQKRAKDRTYSNMTTYTAQYKCWEDTGYAAVGLDGKGEYGLLNDNMVAATREGGYSMAFRSPVAGTVELSFNDLGDGHKDAWLRNGKNTKGKVWLHITKNGTDITERVQIPNDRTGVDLIDLTIDVEKGDYIRLEARNTDGDTNQSSFFIRPVITY